MSKVALFPKSGNNISATPGGTSTNCHPTTLTSSIKVSPDVTQVSTCDSVTVNIANGQKPYTVSVVPGIVAAVPQNFTLGDDDDAFTYVNRIPTGNFFISECHYTGTLFSYE